MPVLALLPGSASPTAVLSLHVPHPNVSLLGAEATDLAAAWTTPAAPTWLEAAAGLGCALAPALDWRLGTAITTSYGTRFWRHRVRAAAGRGRAPNLRWWHGGLVNGSSSPASLVLYGAVFGAPSRRPVETWGPARARWGRRCSRAWPVPHALPGYGGCITPSHRLVRVLGSMRSLRVADVRKLDWAVDPVDAMAVPFRGRADTTRSLCGGAALALLARSHGPAQGDGLPRGHIIWCWLSYNVRP